MPSCFLSAMVNVSEKEKRSKYRTSVEGGTLFCSHTNSPIGLKLMEEMNMEPEIRYSADKKKRWELKDRLIKQVKSLDPLEETNMAVVCWKSSKKKCWTYYCCNGPDVSEKARGKLTDIDSRDSIHNRLKNTSRKYSTSENVGFSSGRRNHRRLRSNNVFSESSTANFAVFEFIGQVRHEVILSHVREWRIIGLLEMRRMYKRQHDRIRQLKDLDELDLSDDELIMEDEMGAISEGENQPDLGQKIETKEHVLDDTKEECKDEERQELSLDDISRCAIEDDDSDESNDSWIIVDPNTQEYTG